MQSDIKQRVKRFISKLDFKDKKTTFDKIVKFENTAIFKSEVEFVDISVEEFDFKDNTKTLYGIEINLKSGRNLCFHKCNHKQYDNLLLELDK